MLLSNLSEDRKEKLKKLKENFLDVLFPRFCVQCGREGSYLCSHCYKFLSENDLVCPHCGSLQLTGATCSGCKSDKQLDGLVVGWNYEGIMKTIGSKLENGHYHLGEKMVERFFTVMVHQEERFGKFLKFLLKEETVVTWLPTTKITSQSDSHTRPLAQKVIECSKKDRSKLVDLLEKTSSLQADKDSENPFQVKTAPGKRVVVVSSLFNRVSFQKAAESLKEAGTKEVWGCVLARSV